MEKLKNPGIKHVPIGNKCVLRLILLVNNLIISALRSSKKNIQNYKRLGRLLFFNCCINIKSFTHKQITMKKLLVIFAIGAFAACNGSASTEAKVDSTATVAKDSVTSVADSAKTAIDSAATAAKDSLKAKGDTSKKK
jgi:hypothetical protein